MIIKQEDGSEVEVFSQDEMTAIQQEFDTKLAESKTVLDSALAEKTRLEGELSKSNVGNNPNFAALKAALDKKDGEIGELRTNQQKIEETRLGDIKAESVSRYAQGDAELAKKILHHFETTLKSVTANSKEEVAKKMESAAKLAQEPGTVDIIGNANYAGSGPGFQPNIGAQVVEPKVKEFGKKFGLTDEDWKKYGNKK